MFLPFRSLSLSPSLCSAELHREVVNRMESGRFVCNPHSLELYVKSLVATRALGENARSSVQNALRRAWERGEKSGGGGALLQPSEVRAAVQTGVGEWGVGGGGGGQSLYPAGGSSTLFPSNPSSSSSATSFSDALGSRANPLHTRDMTNQINPFFRMLMYGASLGLLYYAFNTSMKGGALPGVGGGLGSIMGGPDIAEEISNVPSTRFEDVKGADEAKHELEDIVRFLKDPEKYSRLGAKVPSGVLLTGPPGTGKTLLARAVAGEAGCHFYSKSASEFEEMLVGLGARRVRDLFAAAKKNSPSIIFIDEIDALGGKRRGGGVGGQDRERQTLNQLLSCMDGFSKNEGVIVIAATNAPEILDPALTRPGRFDSMVDVSLPDVKGRREILEYYLEKTVVGPGINSDILAKATPGFSGAQLEAMVNSAALMAASRDAEAVEMRDMEEARDKLIMGPSKVSRVITPAVKRLTAYHEGGHTLINLLSSASPPLHKVTILPRGMSGGATYNLPKEDMRTKTDMLAMIDIALGGRVAEELVFGADNVTTGASSDFQQASSLARSYILQLSMSDIGMSSFDPQFGISEVRRAAVDEEVERMLKDSYARVKALLTRNRPALDRLADALVSNSRARTRIGRVVALHLCKPACSYTPHPYPTPPIFPLVDRARDLDSGGVQAGRGGGDYPRQGGGCSTFPQASARKDRQESSPHFQALAQAQNVPRGVLKGAGGGDDTLQRHE